MFYSQFLLKKGTPLGRLWLAAHWDRSISKSAVSNADITRMSHCSDALSKIQSAFRATDLDLPKDKASGGNAINLAQAAAAPADALGDLDFWAEQDHDIGADEEEGEADFAGAGAQFLIEGSQGAMIDESGRLVGGYEEGQGFDEHLGVADDGFHDDMDGGNSMLMMGLDESSSRIEGLRGEGSTPGRSSAHGSMRLSGEAAASLLQAPGRGASLGMEDGAGEGARASMGGFGEEDGLAAGYDDGGGGDGYMDGFGDMDAAGYGEGGDFGIAVEGDSATPGSALAAGGRSATLEEAVPGGLATAEALMMRRRQGVEDDEAGAAEDAGAFALRRQEAAAAARDKAAARRRSRQAKRAKMAMGDVVLSSDTYRQWLADASPTLLPPSGPALALRRLELSCGRTEDFTRPSGGLIRPRRPDAAVAASLARSAVAGPSSSPLLVSPDLLALLSAASSGGLASRTSKLTQAQAASARRFLARKLREEAGRRGGRAGAVLSGPQAQAAAAASSSSSPGAGAAAEAYGAGYDGGGGDGYMDGFGDMDAAGYGEGDAEFAGYDAASDAGAGAGGAAASISGTDLPNDEDDGGDTESLLGGGEGALSSAESAAQGASAASGRGSAGGGVVADSSTGGGEEEIPEEVWARGRATDAAAAGGADSAGTAELPRMNRRTAKMLGVLEAEFERRDGKGSGADAGRTTLRLQELIGPHKRRTAAVAFYEALVLKNADIVDMVQTRPYGPIAVRRAPRFDEGAAQAASAAAEDAV